MTCPCDRHDDGPSPSRGAALTRRSMLAGGLAAAALPFLPGRAAADPLRDLRGAGAAGTTSALGRAAAFLPPRPGDEVHVRPMMFPVLSDPILGSPRWTDTYLAPRGGGRLHEGQDLMGAKMLQLLACVDGTVVELRHRSTGNALYLRGDDGWYYCYLHINNDRPGTDDGSNLWEHAFAPGLTNGSRVRQGDLLGYLGDSGNAENSGAHLHFEVRMPNAQWYDAAAVNPKYSLDAAIPARPPSAVPPQAFAPLPDAEAFARQQAEDFLGGVPSASWLAGTVAQLEDGRMELDNFIARCVNRPEVVNATNHAIRLYQAYFGGIPAYAGVDLWTRRIRAGWSLERSSADMAASDKFRTMWGDLDDWNFCRRMFINLYEREPSAASVDLRMRRLRAGMTRGQMVLYDCQSPGYRGPSASRTRVISVYHAMFKRPPNQQYLTWWSAVDAGYSNGLEQLINAIRTGPEYPRRF